MAPRESENSVYAKFWGDKQRALWCAMVFSGVVNCHIQWIQIYQVGSVIPPFKEVGPVK